MFYESEIWKYLNCILLAQSLSWGVVKILLCLQSCKGLNGCRRFISKVVHSYAWYSGKGKTLETVKRPGVGRGEMARWSTEDFGQWHFSVWPCGHGGSPSGQLSRPTGWATPSMKPDVNMGSGGEDMSVWVHWLTDVLSGRNADAGAYMRNLCLLIAFAENLTVPRKIKSI